MNRIAIFFLTTHALWGATVFTLNTTPLETSSAGPFTLDFEFIDGDGTGDGNNTVTLSDFSFGGGSIDTTPSYSFGSVVVNSGPFGVVLTDTSFFDDVQFALTPGTSLSFTFSSTTNVDTAAPDTFTFAIDDGSGNEIATTNPNGFDSFVEVDLPTPNSGVVTTLSASAPGASVMLNAPTQSSGTSATPEPSTFLPMTLLVIFGSLGYFSRPGYPRRRKRAS